MKKIIRILALTAILTVMFTGCISLGVSIRIDGGLSTVIAGGTLQLRSGSDIVWSVSSNPGGNGSVAGGTFVSQSGLLAVDSNETSSVLYVTAVSTKNGKSDTKQIRVVTVTGVTITAAGPTVAIGRTLQFRAQVTGTNNPDHAVTWRVSSNAAGNGPVTAGTSINSSGSLTVSLGESSRTLYIFAASIVDPRRTSSVAVTVVVPTVTSVTVGPVNQTVRAGGTLQFSATVMGNYEPDGTVTWRVSSNPSGTGAVTPGTSIGTNGLLTVVNNESLTVLYIIATSTYDTSKSGSVAVSVVKPTVTSITVTPANQTARAGSTMQFSAAVAGNNEPDRTVTWRVSSTPAGTSAVTPGTSVSANGLLTVANNESSRVLYVIATSTFDPTKSGSVAVSILTPAITSVTISPANQSMTAGGSMQFTAAVVGTNNPNTAVTWRVSSNAAGNGAVTTGTSINTNGLLTVSANETNRTLYVFAVSIFDTSKSSSVAVTVNPSQAAVTPPTTPPTVTPPGVTLPGVQTPGNRPGNQQQGNQQQGNQGNQQQGNQGNQGNQQQNRPQGNQQGNQQQGNQQQGNQQQGNQGNQGNQQQTTQQPVVTTPTVTGVTISPASSSTRTNTNVQFSATVSGTNNPSTAVTWTVSGGGAPATAINTSGRLHVAPNEWAVTLVVTATSVADPTKSASANVTITNNNANSGPNQGQGN